MNISAAGAREVAGIALSIVNELRGDIRWSCDEGREEIFRHWSGLAFVQAQAALAHQSAAVVVCEEAMSGVAHSLTVLAGALDEVAHWRNAAQRLADEAGAPLDLADAGLASPDLEWSLGPVALAGARQLWEAAATSESEADAWCAAEISALTALAPANVSAFGAIRAPTPGSLLNIQVDRLPPLDPLVEALPAIVARLRDRPYRPTFVPGEIAEAGLCPTAVSVDSTRPIEAREIAARLVLREEAESSIGTTAQRARTLLDGSRGDARNYALYDPANGTIAEVVGDLATARAIVVFVPGVSSSLTDWSVVSQQIAALYHALRAEPGGEAVAVVGWLGSPAPGNVAEGALQSYAKNAAPRLKRFIEQVGILSDAPITLVGHSYGAVTAGLSVRAGLRPYAIMGVGGPGFGPGVHSVADLGGVPTYVITDPRDPINEVQPVQGLVAEIAGFSVPILGSYVVDRVTGAAGVGHLGTDPVRLGGAHRLSTGNDKAPRPLIATDGNAHTSYFAEGGLTDRQVAAVALGLAPEPYVGPKGR